MRRLADRRDRSSAAPGEAAERRGVRSFARTPHPPSVPAARRSSVRRPPFRPDIQGLRGVAVLAVVLYHAGVPVLRGGYVGVDVFFVISGFLITQLLWRELAADGRIALSRFYARRARRLLPAAALVLGVSLGATYLLLPPLRVADAARDAAAAAVYSANYRFAVHGTDYLGSTGPPSPFQHFWSLGVEEQFYLVFPVLLMLAVFFRRAVRVSRQATAAGLAALGLLSLLLSLHLTATNEPWAFYSLPTRAWELAAGATLALCLPEVRRLPSRLGAVLGWAGVAALLAAAVGFGARTP